VQNVVTFDHGSPVLKDTPKSIAGIRTVPMPKALKEVLEPYVKSLKGLYLFEAERMGGLMSKSSYDKFWGKIYNKLNIAAGGTDKIKALHGFSGHIFKHNYITELYYAGISAKEAQVLAGHSDVKLTLEIYTHLDKLRNVAPDKLRDISML
jgi:integrase